MLSLDDDSGEIVGSTFGKTLIWCIMGCILLGVAVAATWFIATSRNHSTPDTAEKTKAEGKEEGKASAPSSSAGASHDVREKPSAPTVPRLLTDSPKRKDLSGDEVYRHLLRSSAFIATPEGFGSGVLIDRDRKLVVTNAHVTGDFKQVAVMFAAFDAKGEVVTEAKYYLDRAKELGVKAVVKTRTISRDLAIVQLPKLPDNVRPV
ncbi:MAG TPA: trypsin-like peptidase domain-containing protein, partial [Gemmata sp.]|nr:trypsin-like peptidase domain-containing protein [Gemmata sp.]